VEREIGICIGFSTVILNTTWTLFLCNFPSLSFRVVGFMLLFFCEKAARIFSYLDLGWCSFFFGFRFLG